MPAEPLAVCCYWDGKCQAVLLVVACSEEIIAFLRESGPCDDVRFLPMDRARAALIEGLNVEIDAEEGGMTCRSE